jgi:CheY-like chemotaxis protein
MLLQYVQRGIDLLNRGGTSRHKNSRGFRSEKVRRLSGENRWDRVEEESMASRRILVVDDYPNAAEGLARWLRRMGNDVRTALDGIEGIQAAEQFRPDIVLLDLGMPKLDGYETAEKIRQQPWGKRMMLVALTGWAQQEEQQSLRKAGFAAHLVKPVDRAKLVGLLAEYDATWSTDDR